MTSRARACAAPNKLGRRELLYAAAAFSVACARPARGVLRSGVDERRIAVTMDDPNVEETPRFTFQQRNQSILRQLDQRDVQIMLFVCGKRVDSVAGASILRAFDAAGHLLGNHSYAHRNYNDPAMTSDALLAEIARCETLIDQFPGFRRVFRFPFLKEGESIQKRDAMRAALHDEHYSIGHVTIDTSDWAYSVKLEARLKSKPTLDLSPFREAYIAHILDRARYYDRLATGMFGRSIAHTLLVHHTLLNALFIGDVIDSLRREGYRIVGPEGAYGDPIYAMQTATIPAGESLVWSLARADPRLQNGLRYPGEDDSYEAATLDEL
jgi:peptidoglycan/xylan/chitin deacetylase (PgdA/CDA1 family)